MPAGTIPALAGRMPTSVRSHMPPALRSMADEYDARDEMALRSLLAACSTATGQAASPRVERLRRAIEAEMKATVAAAIALAWRRTCPLPL